MKSSRQHILLLENDKGLERSLILLLKQAGFRISSCREEEMALALLYPGDTATQDQADLLIIDISGPGPGAEDLIHRLSELSPAIPLIIIAPYGCEGTIEKLGDLPKSQLLYAPFELPDLLYCLEKTATAN